MGTYYNGLAIMPKRERYVWVCTNRRPDGHPKGSCAEKGSEKFQSELKNAVAQAGLHKRVRVMTSGCQDLCWVGISAVVMPEMTFLGRLTPEDIPAMVEAFAQPSSSPVGEHPKLSEKVVKPQEFDEVPVAPVKLGARRSP
jgi:(2Fe-2S) ferredoxin